MSEKAKSKVQKLFLNDHYKQFLLQCRDDINCNYKDFWQDFTHQEQLTWLDAVVRDSKKLGFGNEHLIKDYINIVCKIGKEFLNDPTVDDNLIRFITDSNFSPYVRVRDANRWIDENKPGTTFPLKV